MATYDFDSMRSLVAANNRSALVSDDVIVCLIWKESTFDDQQKNAGGSATGLMQVTRDAVKDVNSNTPKGISYTHAEMTDASKNIQCGTYYLDVRIKRVSGNVKLGIERFGTGSGYADNILKCGECLAAKRKLFGDAASSAQHGCLYTIHA